MADVLLIVFVVIIAALLLLGAVMLLAYFGHPDDKNEAWVPKFITIAGIWLAFASVLALPYDVSNSRGVGGGLRLDILWQIIYLTIAIFVSIIIPFAYFYYESDTDKEEEKTCLQRQLCQAIIWTFAFFAAFIIILGIMYAFLATTEIPVRRIAQNVVNVVPFTSTTFPNRGCSVNCLQDNFIWQIPVTFPVYVIAFISFLGWWFFTAFVGVGFLALPLDLINEYRTRPEPLTYAQWSEQKKALGQRASYLLQAGISLQKEQDDLGSRSKKREHSRTLIKFEQAYYMLKQDYETLRISKELKGGNPLWYIFKFILGIIGIILSLTWLIHIFIFVLPITPVHPFLNDFFIKLESAGGGAFPLFGIIAFAIYAYYLIWCCVKGCFKLGLRFLIFKIYPMELHNTMMNAFLANTWVILVCAVPTVQFCVRAFPIYSRLTSIDMLFGTQAQYLKFFRYFWQNNVFIYAILAISFLTFVFLFFFPNNKSKEIEKKIQEATTNFRETVLQ